MKATLSPTKYLAEQIKNISAITDVLTETTSDWQTIKLFLANRIDEIKLTPKQKTKLDRYQFLYNQICTGKFTDQEAMNASMKLYNINQRQAYDDMKCTRELFGTVINVNKKFELAIQLQINRNMLRKAEELLDFRAYAALEKNRNAMLAQIEETDESDADMFEGHQIEAVFDPSLIGAEPVDMKAVLSNINNKRKSKIKTELFTELLPENDTDAKATTL